ncbi:MAG: ABC transporter C-terminal domain-containing protein, partial [Bacteroidales bacterium]|nr:ABC transporter C-terminal domain-containing protein [Bacteroidales bacterium]MDY5262107.1 ABC transporter C-terminal domain-containing protein [Candidatus Cryptobacteroides sp.]
LGNEKKELEAKLAGGALSYDELQAASARFGELSAILDEKEMRWLELQD